MYLGSWSFLDRRATWHGRTFPQDRSGSLTSCPAPSQPDSAGQGGKACPGWVSPCSCCHLLQETVDWMYIFYRVVLGILTLNNILPLLCLSLPQTLWTDVSVFFWGGKHQHLIVWECLTLSDCVRLRYLPGTKHFLVYCLYQAESMEYILTLLLLLYKTHVLEKLLDCIAEDSIYHLIHYSTKSNNF